MIILKNDRLTEDSSYKEILMCATKKDILRTYELVNLGVAKSYTKEVLADGLQNFFEHDSYYIVNQLPENEQKLLSQLLCRKMSEYVAVPRNDERHLMMQKIHLVVTYEAEDTWHVYMTDSIRKTLTSHFERDVDNTPGMREFYDVMEKLTECHDRLFAAINNETAKSQDVIVKEVKQIKEDYRKYLKELKAQEAQVRTFGTDVEMLYSQTEEQIKLCDIVIETVPSSNLKRSKEEKMVDDLTMMMVARKEQELKEVEKNEGKPIDFAPAMITMLPLDNKEYIDVNVQLIRMSVMKVTVRMTEAVHMVCYIIKDNGCVRVACRWGDVLDFVWNGVEELTMWNPYTEIKKHFRKKYPVIASLFGQKEDRNGKPLQVPYITTIGMDHQQKEWWLSVKMPDATDEDFQNWYLGGLTEDDEIMDAICDLRDACVDMYNEIARSDAKKPKELLYSLFGEFELRKAGLVEI